MARDGYGRLPAMTDEEINNQLEVTKETRIYGSKADRASMWRKVNDEQLSKFMAISLKEIKNVADGTVKVSLADTEAVKSYTMNFWKLCIEHSVIPTYINLMSAMGYTRRGGDDFIMRNPNHPTTEWLLFLRDHINSIVSNGSMTGALAPIPSLFFLKTHGVLEGTDEMPEVRRNDSTESAETIMEKYSDLPDA
jgi:hypothetical protein